MPIPRVVPLAAVLLLAACSSSGDADTRVAGKVEIPTRTATATVDQVAAEAAVLHLADFPAGWRQGTKDDDGVTKCAGVAKAMRGDTGEAWSPPFEEGTRSVTSLAAVWATEAEADAYLDAFEDPSTAVCVEVLVRARTEEALAEADTPAGVVTSGTEVGRLSVRPAGDRATGLQIVVTFRAEGFAPKLVADYVVVRVGRAVALFGFVDVLSPMGEPRDGLVDSVAARLRQI